MADNPLIPSRPPNCGETLFDEHSERRVRALRSERGFASDAGCGKRIPWITAYRCLECGRWMHADCLRIHFLDSQGEENPLPNI